MVWSSITSAKGPRLRPGDYVIGADKNTVAGAGAPPSAGAPRPCRPGWSATNSVGSDAGPLAANFAPIRRLRPESSSGYPFPELRLLCVGDVGTL